MCPTRHYKCLTPQNIPLQPTHVNLHMCCLCGMVWGISIYTPRICPNLLLVLQILNVCWELSIHLDNYNTWKFVWVLLLWPLLHLYLSGFTFFEFRKKCFLSSLKWMKNDEGWMKNEDWMMKDEGWWFQAVEGFW